MYIGVNHLGHFYLNTLLLDPVLIPNKSRIVSLSSYGHGFGGSYNNLNDLLTKAIQDKDFMGSQKDLYGPLYNYGISKASNILFARQLNTLYKDKGIISVSCHPGAVPGTELMKRKYSIKYIWDELRLYFGVETAAWVSELKNTKQGTATTLRCVTMDEEEIIGGGYYVNCILSSIENRAYDNVKIRNNDDILAKKLWILSETIIENKGFKLKL